MEIEASDCNGHFYTINDGGLKMRELFGKLWVPSGPNHAYIVKITTGMKQ